MNNLALWVFRLMISLLLTFLALIVFLILAPDETPSELSSRLRAEGNSAVGNYGEGFTYLMGIGAPAGAEPRPAAARTCLQHLACAVPRAGGTA